MGMLAIYSLERNAGGAASEMSNNASISTAFSAFDRVVAGLSPFIATTLLWPLAAFSRS